jgi:hypothetical protein
MMRLPGSPPFAVTGGTVRAALPIVGGGGWAFEHAVIAAPTAATVNSADGRGSRARTRLASAYG